MAQVIYRPSVAHGCPSETRQYGYAFGASPVEVTDARHLAKFAGNPFFDVIDGAPAKEPEASPAGDPPADPPADGGFEAKHRGRGSYSVMQGDKEVKDGMTKAEAEDFNSLSAEAKLAALQ